VDLECRHKLLQASHELEEASITRQVLEEDLEHGGFISGDEEEELPLPIHTTPNDKLACQNNSLSLSQLPLTVNKLVNSEVIKLKEQRTVPGTFNPMSTEHVINVGTTKHISELHDSRSISHSSVQESAISVVNLMKEAMTKPTLELFKFNGNPTANSRFIFMFETTTEAVETDDRRKLLYLIQHCTGKPKSLIEYCLLLDPLKD